MTHIRNIFAMHKHRLSFAIVALFCVLTVSARLGKSHMQAILKQAHYCEEVFPYVHVRDASLSVVNNISIFVANSSDVVSSYLLKGMPWETAELQHIKGALEKISDPLFVDVGANIGWFSLNIATHLRARVFSFEAMRRNALLLRSSLCVNNNKLNNLILFNVGLGVKEETCRIVAPVNNVLDGIVKCGAPVSSIVGLDGEVPVVQVGTVHIQTLDALVNEEVQVMKIDVEGYEVAVLKGGASLFSRGHVKNLVFEYFPRLIKDAGFQPKEMFNLLTSWGYKCGTSGFNGGKLSHQELLLLDEKLGNGLVNVFCSTA